MRSSWRSFGRDESGQGLTEYALILALIAILAVAADSIQGFFLNRIAVNHNESLLIDE